MFDVSNTPGVKSMVTIGHRLLQGEDANGGGDEPSQQEAYEFIAFLLWYIFLVICCVLPTCCAYRRRRAVEARLAQQQANMFWLQRSNLFILSNLQNRRNSEHMVAERTRMIGEELKETTMTMSEVDIKKLLETKENAVAALTLKEELATDTIDFDEAEHFGTVSLPTDAVDGDRAIAGLCSICLCAYEDGENISWSPKSSCLHAFHTECIIPWLAKKDEPKCPVCRQDFCEAAVVPEEVLDMEEVSLGTFAGLDNFLNVHFLRPRPAESTPTVPSGDANSIIQPNTSNDNHDAEDSLEEGSRDVPMDDTASSEHVLASPHRQSLEVEEVEEDSPSNGR